MYKSIEKRREASRKSYHKYRNDRVERSRKYRLELRHKVLFHYGNGKIECSCCKEKHLEFLSIDHINGGGTKHRLIVRGMAFYLWLVRNRFPKGYRILCHNCNQAIGFYRYCPHNANVV